MAERKPDETRRQISWALVIVTGLIIGYFIKRVHIGLLIGLLIGLMASAFRKK